MSFPNKKWASQIKNELPPNKERVSPNKERFSPLKT